MPHPSFISLSVIFLCLVDALPLNYPPSFAIVEIEQTLNRFSRSVDTHDYPLLNSVFAEDAIANFDDGAGDLQGLLAIKTALQSGFTGTISQHSLSTQLVQVTSLQKASAISYLQGTFFGQGNLTGQIYTTYGQYALPSQTAV